MTSVLPPASTMARAVSSREDLVRPSRTAVAPSAASLRAMAAPMPRPAPVTTATCPARGCLVSIPLVPPGTFVGMRSADRGTSTFSALRILTIKGRTNGNSLAFGRRGTYNPASREKGQPPHRSNRVSPFTPGAPARKPGHSKAGSERIAVQSECSLEVVENDPRIAISRDFKEPY